MTQWICKLFCQTTLILLWWILKTKRYAKLHKPYVSLKYDTNHKQHHTSIGKYSNSHQPYYIISNLIIDAGFKTEILRNCILDHFAIMLAFPMCEKKVCNKSEQHSHKQMFYEASIQSLRLRLWGVKWHSLKTSNGSN